MIVDLKNYRTACKRLAKVFIRRYYTDADTSMSDVTYYWVADDIGGVLAVNDEFWTMDDIRQAIEHNIKDKKLFDWYHYRTDRAMKNKEYSNMKNYSKGKIL